MNIIETKHTKSMKYEIAYENDLYNLLSDIQYAIWRIKNRAITSAYDWQQFSFSYKERFGEFPKEKEVIGKNLMADIVPTIKELGTFVGSAIVDGAVREAVQKFNSDKSAILRGEVSIQQYKRSGSFPMRATTINGLERINSKKYAVKLSLLSKEGAKERDCKTQVPVTLKTGSGANLILDRIISGDYKLCDSRITKRKNKFYLSVAYQFTAKNVELDENKILGVDLGIANAAYMAVNFGKQRANIEGNEIITFRQRVEARRKSMLRQSKYAGEGRRGHGRKTLLKPTEKLRNKVEDFRRTTNHKYSKYIVDTAWENGCGVIQMENISGIEKRSTFLRQWSYDELQRFVEYKAKERGIKVVYVEPAYTSQRCSHCGNIDKESRKTQSHFHCTTCGFEANADYNAAKNIAEKDIDVIINAQLKAQEYHNTSVSA